jgi:uncharacterized protein HemY
MKTRTVKRIVLAMGIALAAAPAFAQRDATSKITGEAYRVHSQSMYQRNVADRANLLNRYAAPPNQVPKGVVQEQMSGMRRDLSAAKADLSRTKQDYANNREVQQLLASIEKHYAQCDEHCKMMDDDAKMSDMEMVHSCCGKMCEEMQAAQADLEKVMQKLGIKKLEPMKPATTK